MNGLVVRQINAGYGVALDVARTFEDLVEI